MLSDSCRIVILSVKYKVSRGFRLLSVYGGVCVPMLSSTISRYGVTRFRGLIQV